MKTLFVLLWALCLLLPEASAQRQLLDRVVAVVNDEIITQSELDVFLRPIYDQYKEEFSGSQLVDKLHEIRRNLLNQLIEDRLVFQEAEEKSVEIRENEMDGQIKEFKSKFVNELEMEDALQKEGLTLTTLRERLRRQTMVRRLHDLEIRAKVVVSPLEISDYYQSHPGEFSEQDTLKVRSLTVKKNEESRRKGLKDEKAMKAVRDLWERISSGEDFSRLAREFSEDTRAKEGGIGDWIQRGEMIPVIDDVIFNLKVGGISEVIETSMGYHIFRVEERKEGYKRSLDEVRDALRAKLFNEKSQKRFQAWMQELKRDAYISIR